MQEYRLSGNLHGLPSLIVHGVHNEQKETPTSNP
jgi:hypothetical protein